MCVSACSVTHLCPTLCNLTDCSLPESFLHGISQARILEWVGLPFPLPGNLSNPGTEPGSPESPALAGGFFTPEPPEKPERIYKRVNIKHLKNLWLCAYFTCWILMLNNYLILCCKRKRNDQFYSWFCCVLACVDIRDIYLYIHILCVYTQVYYTCIYTIYLYILYVYVYAHTLDLYSFMLLFYLIYKLAF